MSILKKGFVAVAAIGLLLAVSSCGGTVEIRPAALSEGGTAKLVISLPAATGDTELQINTDTGSAFGHVYGSGQDFTIKGYTADDYGVYKIPVKKGAKSVTLELGVTDDEVFETDEIAVLKLSGDKFSFGEGTPSTYTFVIRDNDTKAYKNLREDYGAAGDGKTDDTAKLQSAIKDVIAAGGGVVFIPKGVYMISSVTLDGGVTVEGESGTIIKRPANQGKWCRTFYCNYSGAEDSKPIVVKDMVIDGNSQNQGAYKNYELEQAHLVFFVGNEQGTTTQKGRVRGAAENLTLQNCVGDGVSIYTNAQVGVYNVTATDVFRGGLVVTGGNTSVMASTITTRKGHMGDPGGIDVEVDGMGYGESMELYIKICRFRAEDGDFDVIMPEGATGIFNDCYNGSPFIDIGGYTKVKELTFNNCVFHMGLTTSKTDLIYVPTNMTFNNCDFIASMVPEPGVDMGASWNYVSPISRVRFLGPWDTNKEGTLILNGCRFFVDKASIEPGFKTAAFFVKYSYAKICKVIIKDCEISEDFDYGLYFDSSATIELQNLKNNAKTPEVINEYSIVTRK